MRNLFCLSILSILIISGVAVAQDTSPQPPVRVRKMPVEVPKEVPVEQEKYDVPMIEKTSFKDGKANFAAEIEQLKAEAALAASDDGSTYMTIDISGLKEIAKEKTYVFWLATENGKYKKIGEASFSENEEKTEIKGRVPLEKFGILITAESESVEKPTSKTYVAFKQKADK